MADLPYKRGRFTDDSVASDRSDASFSTDPSQQDDNAKFHYTQRNRAEWVDKIPAYRPKSVAKEINSEQTSNQTNGTSPEDLLNSILQLVNPKTGKHAEVRKLVRDLRTFLRFQHEELNKDCPTGKVIPKEALTLSSGIGNYCKRCGHNHFLCELHRIGHFLYGRTTVQRKHRMTEWINKGTSSYQSLMQEQMESSWLARLLQDGTTRVTVQRVGCNFETKTTVQVNSKMY